MFSEDIVMSQALLQTLANHGYDNTEISLAIIDLTQKKPTVFGYQMDHFIYAASVY